jgi:uncharacterized protein
MRKIFFFLGISILFAAMLLWGVFYPITPAKESEFEYERKSVLVGENIFSVLVADTEAKRVKGLGGREMLGEQEGMLFVFPEPNYPTFWMKDMRIPIDIIWMDSEQVIGFVENAAPEGLGRELALYRPPHAIRYVLEVKAGMVRALGITQGTPFSIQ